MQTDRIDFYLLHSLNTVFWKNLNQLGVFEFLDSAISDGRIKYAGFSFHDEAKLFPEIVDAYDWSFCQIQYNYLDTNYQAGQSGLEYAAAKGLGTIIMEPLKGGRLAAAKIPEAIQAVWAKADIKRTPPEWALRFLWNQPRINLVLSGMSEMEQVVENIEIAGSGEPNSLTEKELSLIEEVKQVYLSRTKVDCTNCQYCMPCPAGVNIPTNFSILNSAYLFDDFAAAKGSYQWIRGEQRASCCTKCGKCEKLCPQQIAIRDVLGEVVSAFEK